jgi:hypothetical protein
MILEACEFSDASPVAGSRRSPNSPRRSWDPSRPAPAQDGRMLWRADRRFTAVPFVPIDPNRAIVSAAKRPRHGG